MNAPLPPPIPGAPPAWQSVNLKPTLLAVAFFAWLGDFLFWNQFEHGLSLAVFFIATAILIIGLRWREKPGWQAWAAFGLLLVSCAATVNEASFTNLCVLMILVAIIEAECWFRQLPGAWARWSESFVAWVLALGRWPWLIGNLSEWGTMKATTGERSNGFGRSLRIVAPAVVLLVVFVIVFGFGNLVFSTFLSKWFNEILTWVLSLEITIGRVIFWFILMTMALALFYPREGAKTPRFWARSPVVWGGRDAVVAFWQSALVLLVLNGLFFAVNTIDVVYLWQKAALPPDVDAKAYLHGGVHSLITATVLSAIVLASIFQQPPTVTRSRALQALGFVWIAQNFMLIAGVFLRLRLYLATRDMTPNRVYVACFLALVAVGFVFLLAHVWHGQTAGRLCWRNALATFALFFVLQFLDVNGWVVSQNVRRVRTMPDRFGFNPTYNLSLGASGWPALIDLTRKPPNERLSEELRGKLREQAKVEDERLKKLNWRERQTRHDRLARVLIEETAKF